MQTEWLQMTSETMSLTDVVARVIYAETKAVSLRLVEALASMIYNAANHQCENIKHVISDNNIFDSLNSESKRHNLLNVDKTDKGFQMCVRVTTRMLHGRLPDTSNKATLFHHDDDMPSWAVARGYVADVDGCLFYA